MEKRLVIIASTLLIALIFLCLAWELWLAPLKPGGSWLALKAVFLLPPLFGILKGRRYTYQWSSLFILFYLAEGSVRVTSDQGLTQWLAGIETLLSLAFFACVVAYARLTRPSKQKAPTAG
ncbi:MAG: DUF2069 domain-containing protein [Pseudomonadota bacterium]